MSCKIETILASKLYKEGHENNSVISSISISSSLHNLLAENEIGSILQDIIQLCIFIKQ